MKFGVHLSTLTKSWDEDYYPYFQDIKNYGYDGVEFPLMHPENFDIKLAKEMLGRYELACTCGTGLDKTRDISSLDPIVNRRGIAHLKRCIDICNALETDVLGGVLYSPWGQCKPRRAASENIKRSLENLARLGDYAKEKGVYLALEMINRYESYFMNTVDIGMKYLKAIDHAHVKLHLDTFHANIEERSVREAIMTGRDAIYHMHFCENNRGIPGTGSINWEQVRAGIDAAGYDRWITLEAFVMANCQVGDDVYIWQNIHDNGHVVAKEGMQFMKTLFGA